MRCQVKLTSVWRLNLFLEHLERGQAGNYTEDITSVANFRLSAEGCD